MNKLFLKRVGILRLALRGGIIILVFILAKELTSSRPNVDAAMGYLFVGGAGLYVLWRAIQSLERSMPRRRREAAEEAFNRDPTLSKRQSRWDTIPFLLGSDLNRISIFPWAGRIEVLLEHVLASIFSCSHPKSRCLGAMRQCIDLLTIGRDHWVLGRRDDTGDLDMKKRRLELRDEEVLQYLLAVLVLISSLFRLHILRWGSPTSPFTRRSLSGLRRRWIPFCLLEPNPHVFPPSLPEEIRSAVDRALDQGKHRKVNQFFVSWVFRRDRTALIGLARSIVDGDGCSSKYGHQA